MLPAVRKWMAWNEPNNPVFLRPQYAKVGKKYIPVAARNYAQMCSAIWAGVHATNVKETVACGATDPRGNNRPRSSRAVDRAAHVHAGAEALRPARLRRLRPPPVLQPADRDADHDAEARRRSVTLANIGQLTTLLTRLWGPKKLWITEYGYQTRPPDRNFGVSWAKQAQYLTKAYAVARRNPRITLMLWFLLRDETRLAGWQSGLLTASGKKKPAFNAFMRLRH